MEYKDKYHIPQLTLICMPMFVKIYGAELTGHVGKQFLFYLESSMLGIQKVK